jgi:cysteine synthase
LEGKLADQTYYFADAEAVAMSNRLAAEEGFFCGISSGLGLSL